MIASLDTRSDNRRAACFVAAWVGWLTLSLFCIDLALPTLLQHLYPAAFRQPALFLLATSVVFVLLGVPIFGDSSARKNESDQACDRQYSRQHKFFHALIFWLVIALTGLAFSLLMLSHIHPLALAVVGKSSLVLAVFIFFSLGLFRVLPQGYFFVQGAFAALPPLTLFWLTEMNEGQANPVPAVAAVSIFQGLSTTFYPVENAPHWWITPAILWIAGTVCCLLPATGDAARD